MSIIYEYNENNAPQGDRLELEPNGQALRFTVCHYYYPDWSSLDADLPPDEQVKLFQALAAHLAGTDHTPGLSYFTNWLTSFLSPDDLLAISHKLITFALAAKGEAGFAPGEPTENLGEWSEDEQT